MQKNSNPGQFKELPKESILKLSETLATNGTIKSIEWITLEFRQPANNEQHNTSEDEWQIAWIVIKVLASLATIGTAIGALLLW